MATLLPFLVGYLSTDLGQRLSQLPSSGPQLHSCVKSGHPTGELPLVVLVLITMETGSQDGLAPSTGWLLRASLPVPVCRVTSVTRSTACLL